MQRQLAAIIDEFQHAQSRLELLEEAVSDERWVLRTDPARWSAGECIVHLNLTSAAYIPRLREAIARARQLEPVTAARYRRDPAGWFLSVMIGPLPSIGKVSIGRVNTPAPFVPSGNLPKQLVVSEFKRLQDELVGIVREGDGLAIDGVFIKSPFGEKISYSCYSAFVILPRHQERHLNQAVAAK